MCITLGTGGSSQNFKLLVETLLTTHLAEIGVSEQDFAAACASGIRSGNKVHRKLFDMIVAVDDYISKRLLSYMKTNHRLSKLRYTVHRFQASDDATKS